MRLILDAGALIALERNDRAMWTRLKDAHATRVGVRTHGGVLGQVWRGRGARQARLAKALEAIDVRPLDRQLGRGAGALLERARKDDVIDAALVLLAEDDDTVFTSDPDDLHALLVAAGREIELIAV